MIMEGRKMDDTDDMNFFFSIDAQSNDIVVRKMHDTDGMSFVFYIDALHIYI